MKKSIMGGCSSSPKAKIFSFESLQKITVTSISGEKIEVTDEDMMQQITDNIASIQFERGESSKNTNGFGPIITWYDSNGDIIETLSVMSEDEIMYNDYFWTVVDGSINVEIINNILSTDMSKQGEIIEFNAEEAIPESTVQEFDGTEKEITEETINPEDFGLPVLLPENQTWIKNVEYYQADENNLEIHYYDGILDADCILLAVKDGILDLSDNEYDESLEESWEGNTASGQRLYVKVQHSTDGKMVLATWEYNNYKFAIQGSISDDTADTSSIPKTALYVISNFESQ